MKIYTEVNWQWDDEQNKLVEVSSASEEYEGHVHLLSDDDELEDYYDDWGEEIEQDIEDLQLDLAEDFGPGGMYLDPLWDSYRSNVYQFSDPAQQKMAERYAGDRTYTGVHKQGGGARNMILENEIDRSMSALHAANVSDTAATYAAMQARLMMEKNKIGDWLAMYTGTTGRILDIDFGDESFDPVNPYMGDYEGDYDTGLTDWELTDSTPEEGSYCTAQTAGYQDDEGNWHDESYASGTIVNGECVATEGQSDDWDVVIPGYDPDDDDDGGGFGLNPCFIQPESFGCTAENMYECCPDDGGDDDDGEFPNPFN